jgi:hypothetical protein
MMDNIDDVIDKILKALKDIVTYHELIATFHGLMMYLHRTLHTLSD